MPLHWAPHTGSQHYVTVHLIVFYSQGTTEEGGWKAPLEIV